MFESFYKTFLDKAIEKKFLLSELKSTKRILFFSIAYFTINVIVLIYSDIVIIAYDDVWTHPVLISRFAYLFVVTIISFIIINAQMPKTIDLSVFVFFIMVSYTSLMAHYHNPQPEELAYSVELTVLLAIYIIFPINLKYRLIGAVIYSITLTASLSKGVIPLSQFYQVIVLVIVGNIIGFFVARYNNATFRRLYLRLENMHIMKTEIELATNDIKIVKGIIPICANCKKIRDDSGFWNQLEPYFNRISNMEFIGEKCPKCIAKDINET